MILSAVLSNNQSPDRWGSSIHKWILDRLPVSIRSLLDAVDIPVLSKDQLAEWLMRAQSKEKCIYNHEEYRVVEQEWKKFLVLSRSLQEHTLLPPLSQYTISQYIDKTADCMNIPGLQVFEMDILMWLIRSRQIDPRCWFLYVSRSRIHDGCRAYDARHGEEYNCCVSLQIWTRYLSLDKESTGDDDIHIYPCYLDLSQLGYR